MEGLIGLTQGPNQTEQSYRDLAVLGQLEQKIQMDKQREILAAQQEAQVFDKLYEQADQMLLKDKKKVNQRIRMAQDMLRQNVAANGGSRASFMENGGGAYLSEMSNELINSEEVNQYKENKKNLSMIMWAQQNGLGGRLLPKDLQSMMNYDASEDGGKISYSGIMNEVKIPPHQKYALGQEIPVEDIMDHQGNMMSILANYKMMFPDRQIPNPNTMDGRRHIGNFVRSMGWGDTGSMVMKTSEDGSGSNGTSKGKGSDPEHSQTNNYATWLSMVEKDIPMEQLLKPKEEGGYGGDIVGKYKGKDKFTDQIFREENPMLSSKVEFEGAGHDDNNWFIPDGVESFIEGWDNKKFKLKGSYKVFNGNEATIAKEILGEDQGFAVDGRYVKEWEPKGEVYRNDGVKVGSGDYSKYKGNYEVMGVFSAVKAKGKTDKLLIDVYDKNGKLDEKATNQVHEGYLGKEGVGTAKPTMVIGLKNEEGVAFYQEIDAETAAGLTNISLAMGKEDDISPSVNMQNESQTRIDNIEKFQTEQRIEYESAMKRTQPIFQEQNSSFDFERQKFFAPGSGGQQNRDKEMQAFYIAADAIYSGGKVGSKDQPQRIQALTNQQAFSKMVANTPEVEQKWRNFESQNSEQLIQSWLNDANSDLQSNEVGYKQNQQIAQLWKQILYQL